MNPIEESKQYLVECGYTEQEAVNLISAVRHKDPEKLSDMVTMLGNKLLDEQGEE